MRRGVKLGKPPTLMKSPLICGLLFLSALSAGAAPELTGVMVTSERTAVTLIDSATNDHSNWLQVGDSFEGYTLKSYDVKKGLLILANASSTLKLRLNEPSIPAAQIQLTGTIRLIDGRKIEVEQVTLTAGQTSTFPLGDNTTCDITPTDQGDGTLLYKMNFQRTDPNTGVTVLGTPRVIAARGKSFSVQVGKLAVEFHDRS